VRWCDTFITEVAQTLVQLGVRACPACAAAKSLTISPFPVLLVDAGFPSCADSGPAGLIDDGDVTFAVRLDCATCGHLLLFNAQKYRSGDEKIMVVELTEEQERQLSE
jgi:hypothetical protein